MRKGACVGRNTNTKLHFPLYSVAVALQHIFIFVLSLLLLPNFVVADGRTNEPSHQTLFSNVITSYTDANAVTIADAQGLVTTGKVSIGTASTIDEGLTIAHSTGAIGLRPSGQSGVQIRNNAGRFEVNTGSGNEFVVLQNGNVGIGTTGPLTFLHIKGQNVGNRGQLTLEATDYAQLTFYAGPTTGTNLVAQVYTDSTTKDFVIKNTNNDIGGNLIFHTKASGAESMRIDVSGNVGIGTTSPGAKLDINGNLAFSSSAPSSKIYKVGLRQLGFMSDDSGTAEFWFEPANAQTRTYGVKLVILGPNAAADWTKRLTLERTAAGYAQVSTDSGDLALMPNGNVGIGTTSNINEKLTMVGNIGFSSSSGVAPDARLQRGTLTDWQGNGRTAIQSTHPTSGQANIFEVMSGGEAQIITLQATNPPAIGTRNNNALILLTNNEEKVRITSGGNVGIGRIPTANRLEVEGTASKTTAGDWLANSDIRIKTDVQDIENALDAINKLRPVKFRYTDEYRTNHSIEDKYYYNFIAQEFKEVFPNSVKEDGEGYLQLDAYPVRPYLVAAVQELAKENEALKQRIEALENKK